MTDLPGSVHVCSLSWVQEDKSSLPKVVSQVNSEEFGAFTGVSDVLFFFSWQVHLLYLGVEGCLEGQEKRRAGGYLTRLQSEHLFQVHFLGCKNGLRSHFLFSLKSFGSSLWVSNTVLASWKGWMWDKGRILRAVGGAGGSRQGCLWLCRCCALPTSAPNVRCFWQGKGWGSALPRSPQKKCLVQHFPAQATP